MAVDADEIRRLGKRFRKLDLDNSGALSIDEFMSLPELQQNPLVQRVIDIFDADGNGEVRTLFLSVSKDQVRGTCEASLGARISCLNLEWRYLNATQMLCSLRFLIALELKFV